LEEREAGLTQREAVLATQQEAAAKKTGQLQEEQQKLEAEKTQLQVGHSVGPHLAMAASRQCAHGASHACQTASTSADIGCISGPLIDLVRFELSCFDTSKSTTAQICTAAGAIGTYSKFTPSTGADGTHGEHDSQHTTPDVADSNACSAHLQETSDALTQRERKVAAERSELDQQRRFQEKQAAHLVSGKQGQHPHQRPPAVL